MKNFAKYLNAIAKSPMIPKKAKMTATVLMPELDTTEGIYRSILPSYIINGGENELRMLIVGLSANTNISRNAKDFHITGELIKETDHFVFPFVSYPLRPIVDAIKAAKPSMKFSYYIDANYYLMPDTYPFAKEYKFAKMIDIIEDNIRVVDQVITTNRHMNDYIAEKLKERHPGVTFGTNFFYQRLFILPSIMETGYTNEPVKGKIKALMIGDEYQFTDMNFVSGILTDFKKKYKEAFELTVIGWNGTRNDKTYLGPEIFTYYKKVPYDRYFETIKHIGPNVLIVPAKKNKFNDTSKNYVKYLEFAHMNVPVIAPFIDPYADLIKTNENGFLCEDKDAYSFQLESMFTEPAKYEGTLGIAYATASDYIITQKSNIDKLIKIYFPGYER